MTTPLRFKNMEELKKQYCLALAGRNSRSLVQTLDKIYSKAMLVNEGGDEEEAYILFMKYLTVLTHIQKSKEYKDDPTYFQLLIGTKAIKALDIAEALHNSLSDRYSQKEKLNKARIHVNNKEKEKIEELILEPAPDMRIKEDFIAKSYITAVDLFNLMRDGTTNLLCIDVRSSEDFQSSRIDEKYVINIPEELIAAGQSANVLENNLSEDVKSKWKLRGSYDQIILLDWHTSENILDKNSKVLVLQNILTKWDIHVSYNNPILVLNGGYDEWLNRYPWCTTNPKQQKPSQIVNNFGSLEDVNYPDLKQLSWEAEIFNKIVDRTLKPGHNRIDLSVLDENGEPSTRIRPPVIDRAKKEAALKTYEERREDIVKLLEKKEEETAEAVKLERKRLEKEEELHEAIRQQREAEADEEQRLILLEAEEELLLKMEELKEESKSKDSKIEELEEIIKVYKNRDGEETKKFINVEKEIEEQEINERINKQEEEKEELIKKREEIEKSEESERRILEEILSDKLKDVRDKKKKEIDKTELEKKVNERIPTIDRSVKPRPVVQDNKIRDFSPVSGSVGRGLTGLKNLGNTCYMNSIVQCISNNTSLAKYFCSNLHLRDINTTHKSRGEIAEEVGAVVRALWSGKFKCIASRDLKFTVGRMKSEYSGYDQQDSHEFLTFLMDWLHNDLNQAVSNTTGNNTKTKYQTDTEREWCHFKKKNESLISTLFYGLQKSTVTCVRCSEKSITYEPFSNLSLIIPSGEYNTLDNCLSLYLKEERISGWKCPRCGYSRDAEKKTDICKLPPILVVHLKRFDYVEILSRKRTSYIDFPTSNLNMDCYVNDPQKYCKYNLYAVSNHYGTMEGGHYTAYCRNGLYNRWYKFDDHDVREISPSDVMTSAAYILFYSAVSVTVPNLSS